MNRALLVGLSVGIIGTTGCLPGDTRPDPGRVYLTAEPSDATVNGFTTDDGWTIRFERVLMALGYVWLVGDECNVYTNTSYERFFDFAVPGAQKIAEVYGLGQCDVEFLWWKPEKGALMGEGVSREDFQLLSAKNGDKFVTYVRGSAVRKQQTIRFEWRFRRTTYLGDCRETPDAAPTSSFSLEGGDDPRPRVVIHAENLFRAIGTNEPRYEFNIFASADNDGDGELSRSEMDELIFVQESPGSTVFASLHAFLEATRLPSWVEMDGASCREIQPAYGDDLPF